MAFKNFLSNQRALEKKHNQTPHAKRAIRKMKNFSPTKALIATATSPVKNVARAAKALSRAPRKVKTRGFGDAYKRYFPVRRRK